MARTSKLKLSVSGFFPFLNDWGTIGSLVTSLDEKLGRVCREYEIIIVDDGSDQRAKEILKVLKRKFPKLRIVTHEKNLGYGGAIKSGIKASRMDWIFYTDGDAQYDPGEVELLLAAVTDRVDVVNGYKIKRADPWYRVILGRLYHHLVKFFFNVPIRDTDCDFRLMRRRIFDEVRLESNSGLICVEMVKKIADFGYKFKEVPVHHYWRISGKSQFFNFRRVGRVAFGLSVLWYRLVVRREHLQYGIKMD